jgi:hypothetical protein
VLAAVATGGAVQRVVLHPLAISRTDVSPNPAPLAVVWAGPLCGVMLPLSAAGAVAAMRWRIAYLFTFFAGFCLVANGAYLGVGAFEPVGDADDMLRLGSPRWLLIAFGLATAPAGLYLMHRASVRMGFGPDAEPVKPADAWGVLIAAAAAIAAVLVWGGEPQ